jgi:hypothetical protein
MPDFRIGEVYFALKYRDRFRGYPRIDSYVYLGKNLSDDDDGDTWYFEYLESYSEALGTPEHGSRERQVHCATSSDVSDFLDIGGLAQALRQAADRRHSISE